MAWEDDNHNGKFDTGEPKLQHWTVTPSNGMTRKTDVLGNYYFAHLPAGSYTVGIGVPFLWSQTFPHSLTASPGVHQVLLDRGEARTNLDFGERLTVIVVGGGDDLPIKRQ